MESLCSLDNNVERFEVPGHTDLDADSVTFKIRKHRDLQFENG